MDRLNVALGERSYDILIGGGLLAEAGAHIRPMLTRPFTAIVTDETVAALHLEALREGLSAEGIESDTIILPPGEATKNIQELEGAVDWLLGHAVERRDVVIALGGGVITDITGYAAASLLRGVPFVGVPENSATGAGSVTLM